MSFRASDHWPAPFRNCNNCGREFQAESWSQMTCRDCLEEVPTQEGGGNDHDDRD